MLLCLHCVVELFYEKAGIAKGDANKAEKLAKSKFSFEVFNGFQYLSHIKDIQSVTSQFHKHNVKSLLTGKINKLMKMEGVAFHGRSLTTPLKELIKDLAQFERVPIVEGNGKIVAVVSQAMVVSFLVKNVSEKERYTNFPS